MCKVLEKSDSYYRRQKLMENLDVPMMSETSEELGTPLADVFFQTCPDALREFVGLEPVLEGPQGDLWISPSDLLTGKVVLKPPLTNKYIKALTHEGILEIGYNVEMKFRNEMEIEKQKALKAQADYLNFVHSCELNMAVQRAREEAEKLFEAKVAEMKIEFENNLRMALDELEQQLREECEQETMRKESELEEKWKQKLKNTITNIVEKLTEDFLVALDQKEQELTEHFEWNLERERRRLQLTVRIEKSNCKCAMNQLKHNLECKNIANIMYVICMERRKCEAEKIAIEKRYKTEIEELEKANEFRQDEIDRLVAELKENERKLNVREECVLEILRQFQKFINFALRATPTQAEFLLSVEKMMLFEFTRGIAKDVQKECFEGLQSWKSDTNLTSTETASGIVAKDFHACLNEVTPPCSEFENDFLPAVYYRSNMYLREDFRNMISQGIEISSSNMLWNRDVENLMVILKKSIEKVKEDSTERSVSTISRSIVEKSNSPHSSVHFDKNLILPAEEVEITKRHSVKSAPTSPTEFSSHARYSNRAGSLLCARNSLELVKEHLKKEEHDIIPQDAIGPYGSQDCVGLLAVSDSITKYKSNSSKSGLGRYRKESLEASARERISSVDFHVETKPIVALESIASDSVSEATSCCCTNDSLSLTKKPVGLSKDTCVKNSIENITAESEETVCACAEVAVELESAHDSSTILCVDVTAPKMEETISVIASARDSIELAKMIQKKDSTRKGNSKMSLHVDSLEVLKKRLKCSKTDISKLGQSQESLEIKDGIIQSKQILSNKRVSLAKDERYPSDVYDLYTISDSPWKIYKNPATKKKKPASKLKLTKKQATGVIGDKTATEHKEKNKTFTVHRISSLMRIFNKNPSLIKMFTGCSG